MRIKKYIQNSKREILNVADQNCNLLYNKLRIAVQMAHIWDHWKTDHDSAITKCYLKRIKLSIQQDSEVNYQIERVYRTHCTL